MMQQNAAMRMLNLIRFVSELNIERQENGYDMIEFDLILKECIAEGIITIDSVNVDGEMMYLCHSFSYDQILTIFKKLSEQQ